MTVVAFSVLIGGLLLNQQEASATDTTDNNVASMNVNSNDIPPCWNNNTMDLGPGHGGFRGDQGSGHRGPLMGYGSIQVSEEFQQNIVNIAENDTDVQNLLAEGYNITVVRPELSTVIDAQGYVTTRATTAVLILQKDMSGIAYVTVSVEDAKVTQIVIFTRTVIEKT
jgi:hypothetical protein